MHDVISLLRREVRTYSTYLILPLVIEMSVPSLESIYVLGIDIDSVSTVNVMLQIPSSLCAYLRLVIITSSVSIGVGVVV